MFFPVREVLLGEFRGIYPQQILGVGFLRVSFEIKASGQHGGPVNDHDCVVIQEMLRIRKDRHVLFIKPFFETGLVFAFFSCQG